MKATLFHPGSRDLRTEGSPEFRIVIIYEDAAAGRQARQFSDRLLREAWEDCVGVRNLWTFDVLGIREVRNAAASAAAAADLVIVAAAGGRELSPEVEDWLELWAWLIDRADPAVVALVQQADGRAVRNIRARLRLIAKRKGLEFFAPTAGEPDRVIEREYDLDAVRWPRRNASADGAVRMAAQPAGEPAGCVVGADEGRWAR